MFAREFNSATLELPGEEQYAPTYLLSPLGALINRVYFTGVLTECENIGTDLEPLWRGRVSDPTDVFYISAGQFQPQAARILSELEVPALIGIVGKCRTYSPDDTTTYVSVRVEQVKTVTQELRDYWVLEACRSLGDRLNCISEARRMDPPSIDKLMSLGFGRNVSAGVIEAINQFDTIDLVEYEELLMNTLKELSLDSTVDRELVPKKAETVELSSESEIDIELQAVSSDIEPSSKEPQSKEDKTEPENDSESSEVQEKLIFEIITSLVEDNPDGVIYDDVQEKAGEQGLERAQVEEYISSLIDKGMIYEPSIGLFKAV
jgi:RPA family protein